MISSSPVTSPSASSSPSRRPSRKSAPVRRATRSYFATWLQEQVATRDWTERELAERVGVSRAAVCRWLAGNRVPNAISLPRLADALSVSWPVVASVLARDGFSPIPLRVTLSNGGINPVGIPSDQENFPGWLASELERRGMSSRELAYRAGEESTVVDFWLRGLLSPTSSQVAALVTALSAA